MQQKFGGKIIDIVSGDMRTPELKQEALNAVKSTILEIFLIVVFGYDSSLLEQFPTDHIVIFLMISVMLHEFPGVLIGSLNFLGVTVQFAQHFELGSLVLLVKGLLHDSERICSVTL